MKRRRLLFGVGLLLLTLIGQPVLSQDIPFTDAERQALSQSVVMITTSQDTQGSGVIISADGVIWTNAHVVEDDDDQIVDVWMYGGENRRPILTYRAEVIESDQRLDFAQLQITTSANGRGVTSSSLHLNAIQSTSSDVSQGDSIYLFGYPTIAENVLNITPGNITAIPSRSYGQIYYSDAEFAFGGSGGLVVNVRRQAIGIASANRPDGSGGRLVDIIPVPTICSNVPSACDSAAPPTTPPPNLSFSFTVSSTIERNYTDAYLNVGDEVTIDYTTGEWRAGPLPTWPYHGPEGDPQTPNKLTFPVRDAPIMSLVFGIGNQVVTTVGRSYSFIAAREGLLWLGANDDNFSDNEGSLQVQIIVVPR